MVCGFLSRKTASILACLLAIAAISLVAIARDASPPIPTDVLIKNAFIMTATRGNIPNGRVYIKDGKIAAIGAKVTAPSDVTVVDAGGK